MAVPEQPNPYREWSDDTIVGRAAITGSGQVPLLAEMTRRLKDVTTEQNRASEKLGGKIWWLNAWLLVFTIAIFVLTGALVAEALGYLRWLGHR
jgi:hypothetical protein